MGKDVRIRTRRPQIPPSKAPCVPSARLSMVTGQSGFRVQAVVSRDPQVPTLVVVEGRQSTSVFGDLDRRRILLSSW
jgi:hypothetical protein